jgi:hypothetical protein
VTQYPCSHRRDEVAVQSRLVTSPRPHLGGYSISSFCSGGGCVGVAVDHHEVSVIDTKVGEPSALRFTPTEWAAFVAGVKAGEFDLP